MIDLLLFLLATYGLAAIMIEGCPTEPIRKFIERVVPHGDALVRCYLCMGFWCAVICWLLWRLVSQVPIWILAGAGTAFAIDAMLKRGEIEEKFETKEEEG
jgi:hypothetical protein